MAFEFFDDEQAAVNSFFPDRALEQFDVLDFVQQIGDPNSKRVTDPAVADRIDANAATSAGFGPDPHR